MCRAFQQFIIDLKTPSEPSDVFISMANKLAAEMSFCHTESENKICARIRNILSNNANLWGGCTVSTIKFSRKGGTEKGQQCETDISFCLDGMADIDHCIASVEFKKDGNILYAFVF